MASVSSALMQTILAPITDGDAWLSACAEEGIEAALGADASVAHRIAAAASLRGQLAGDGFVHVDASGEAGLGPLFLEPVLLRACRTIARHGSPTLVVTGLPRRRARQRAEVLSEVQRTLRRRLSPSARVCLIAA